MTDARADLELRGADPVPPCRRRGPGRIRDRSGAATPRRPAAAALLGRLAAKVIADADPRHRRGRLCRLGVRRGTRRRRPRRRRPRRPVDRPPRPRYPRRALDRRQLRRPARPRAALLARARSTRSSIARLARWSASRSRTRRGTSATTSPAAIALLEAARDGRRAALRVLVDRGGLRRPRRHADRRRTRRSGRSTRTARRSGRSRPPCAGTAGRTGCGAWSLRYFNVAGATERLGEDHDPETHLIPNVLRAVERRTAADALRRRLPDAGRHARSATTSTSPTWPTRTCARSSDRARRARPRGSPSRSSATSATATGSRSGCPQRRGARHGPAGPAPRRSATSGLDAHDMHRRHPRRRGGHAHGR